MANLASASSLLSNPTSLLFGSTPKKSTTTGDRSRLQYTPQTPRTTGLNGNLFGSYDWTPTSSTSTLPNSTFASSSLGYFMFPTGVQPTVFDAEKAARIQEEEDKRERRAKEEADAAEARWKREEDDRVKAEAALKAVQDTLAKSREARVASEAEQARESEELWVQSGGVLRGPDGQRDLEKTQRIREELRLREVEKRLTERWEAYEKRWRKLVLLARDRGVAGVDIDVDSQYAGSDAGDLDGEDVMLKFADIPWPIEPPSQVSSIADAFANITISTAKSASNDKPAAVSVAKEVELSDLTLKNIQEFLYAPLTVRGSTISKKQRVRKSLLRWHPDKLTGITALVEPSEKAKVVEGVHAVVRVLQKMNAAL
ncbi:hypothetical protein FA15DRAFT_676228 [Coprinopsis marcescibilis]|uniref:J domain-containing protein n=1 Tax=Coprinopsis marcescibilis TaxID=230819 RepID=A0A5C3KAT5_COPMA|nr:hypothetical protein FA15DRAFT_676228 [Coprinopsis marcescibilis]